MNAREAIQELVEMDEELTVADVISDMQRIAERASEPGLEVELVDVKHWAARQIAKQVIAHRPDLGESAYVEAYARIDQGEPATAKDVIAGLDEAAAEHAANLEAE